MFLLRMITNGCCPIRFRVAERSRENRLKSAISSAACHAGAGHQPLDGVFGERTFGAARGPRSVLLLQRVEQVLQDSAEDRAARSAGEKARQSAGKAHARGDERREPSFALRQRVKGERAEQRA